MTEQANHFLELSDILSFRLECSTCHSFVVIPLAKFQSTPRHCPNGCGKEWEHPHTNTIAASLTELLGAIQTAQRATLQKGLLFTIEIAQPPATKEQAK
jgi:hypothetical protein